MGEVYRAKDTRLNRTVAIKVLPGQVSNRADLRQRFEREARAVSSLNHPHICALYDIGHQNGIDYLVMEYLEGETLAQRLIKGALPLDQVLRYAVQIADALDQAHRHDIVHRDLKPGNIMLTRSGAKLLDFGLAKLKLDSGAVLTGLSALATGGQSLTAEGTILGTVQYMAPEQLEGKEADARTDIFAFGAVVYEVATGHKAFTGKSHVSLIAAILEHEPPPLATLQPLTPLPLERLVKKCLAKDPEERWQTAHDLKDELKWIAEAGSQAGQETTLGTPHKSHQRLAWSLAVLGFLATVTLVLAYINRGPTDVRSIRFIVPPPEHTSFAGSLSLSPDGRRLAFTATDSAGRDFLWVRPLNSLSAQPLTGTEGATHLFWSPDNRFIGFFAQGKLKKIAASGAPAQTVCDAPDGRGGTWSRDGVILFTPKPRGALYRVPAAGGIPTTVTTLNLAKEFSHRWPQFLPDGHRFLYLIPGKGIYVGSLDSKESWRFFDAGSGVEHVPPGYLLFIRDEMLMAQAFDANQVRLRGEPFPIAEQAVSGIARGHFSTSENGVLAYRSTRAVTELVWFDRAGKELGSLGPPGEYSNPRLSPDGKSVVVERLDPQTRKDDLWLIDSSRGIFSRFTFDTSGDFSPLYSPDGSRIVFASNRAGSEDLYQKASSGTGKEEVIFKSSQAIYPTDWSRDGRFIVYSSPGPKGDLDMWVLPLFGDGKPLPYLQREFDETSGQFSPDGRWMAYVSNETGRNEVYVQSLPTTGGKRQVSSDGGSQPRWRGDGKELFYLAADRKLMAVAVRGGTSLETAVPRALFETRLDTSSFHGVKNNYVVTADAQRFLINTPAGEASSAPITVVVNWIADLKNGSE
jgi:serine/threonine protein kinase